MVDKDRMERLFSAVGMDMERHATPTPSMPLFTTGIQEPPLLQGITIPALYAAAYECMVLRSILNHLSVETFRKGWGWKPKFVVKSVDTDQEFAQEYETDPETGGEVRKADRGQIEYADTVLKAVNSMGQTFIDVLKEIEMDLNIVDDAYLVFTKEYFIDPKTKNPVFMRIKEVTRADPIFMRILSDKRGVRGGSQYTSLIDRSFRTSDRDAVCPISGMRVMPIHYMNLAGVGSGQVYTDGEILHISKWSPSKLYGRSPVATMWRQVNTLIAMDNYVYSAYQKRRMPRGVMVIKSSNMETVERTARNIQEHLERDPNYIPTIGVETESGRGGLEYVRMMDTLEELQYIPIKDDIRQRISSFYGVSNVFMNDVSGGGLNNEGMQIVVSNRSVSFAQSIYNRLIFPSLLKQFNIDEWEISLTPHEEEDEIMQLRRDEMAIRNMMQMKQAGYEAKLRDDVDDVYLKFDFAEPDPAQVQAEEAAMAQQQPPPGGGGGGAAPPPPPPPPPPGGGQQPPLQKGEEIGDFDLFKRDTKDSIHGDEGPLPEAVVTTKRTELPAARKEGQAHQRNSGGVLPDRTIRNEGAARSTKGDKHTDDPPELRLAEAKLRRLNITGQRGEEDKNNE